MHYGRMCLQSWLPTGQVQPAEVGPLVQRGWQLLQARGPSGTECRSSGAVLQSVHACL